MRQYERWTVQAGTRGPELHLEQGRNALVNVFFGGGIVGVGIWMRTRPDLAGFGLVLLIFGGLWVLLSFLAGKEVRTVRLGPEEITREGKDGTAKETWPRERAAAVEVRRKRRKGKKDSPLPWRVELVDEWGTAFGTTFRFQAEEVARDFSSELASLLEIPVRDAAERTSAEEPA